MYFSWFMLISFILEINIFLILGPKVSFISNWKFGFLFGEPTKADYFRKSAGTSYALDFYS